MTFQKNAVAVRAFAAAMTVAAWLQKRPNRLTPPPFRLLQISSAFWQSRALYVAAKLDIAGVLSGDSLSEVELAERVAAHPDSLYRLMRLLAAMGVFTEQADGRFGNNRLSNYLRADHPRSVRAMILMHNSPEMSRPWFEPLEQGVRTGEVPFELTYGQPFYAYQSSHSAFDALFATAMDSIEALIGDCFVDDFAWNKFQRIIDVGGSNGSKAIAILRRHPQLTALVFDRDSVIRSAIQRWNANPNADLSARLSFQSGDLLLAAPQADNDKTIYLLSAVLHGMADAECIQVLRNLAQASGDSGARVAVMELVMPETGADLAGASFDMQLLMATRGRERSLQQWQTLFELGGWRLEQQVKLRSVGQILVLQRYGKV